MRLILLLIVLVIGGLLVARQLQAPKKATPDQAVASKQSTPQVPTTPQGVPAFKKSINHLVNQTNNQEKKIIQQDTK